VVATGKVKIKDDGTVRAPDVKKGDKILVGKHSDTEVKIEDEECLILRVDDLLVKVTLGPKGRNVVLDKSSVRNKARD